MSQVAGTSAGKYALFADSGNTYLFVSGGAAAASDDLVVQLVGVALPSTTAPTTGTSQTGILGFGA